MDVAGEVFEIGSLIVEGSAYVARQTLHDLLTRPSAARQKISPSGLSGPLPAGAV